jgi:hypothetical protein
MPFRQYAAYFTPEELDTLTTAFNLTWQALSVSDIDLSTEEEILRLRRNLAQRILVSATAGGIRDVDTLKEEALRSLGKGMPKHAA